MSLDGYNTSTGGLVTMVCGAIEASGLDPGLSARGSRIGNNIWSGGGLDGIPASTSTGSKEDEQGCGRCSSTKVTNVFRPESGRCRGARVLVQEGEGPRNLGQVTRKSHDPCGQASTPSPGFMMANRQQLRE